MERMTHEKMFDVEFLWTILLTSPAFVTSSVLLTHLVDRFVTAPANAPVIRTRVVNVIQQWMSWFYFDLYGNDRKKSSDILENFLTCILPNAGMPGALEELLRAKHESEVIHFITDQ